MDKSKKKKAALYTLIYAGISVVVIFISSAPFLVYYVMFLPGSIVGWLAGSIQGNLLVSVIVGAISQILIVYSLLVRVRLGKQEEDTTQTKDSEL